MISGDWRPTAPLAALRLRARLLARIRAFFEARSVLEVETPLLGHATVTDPHLESLRCDVAGELLYLQTSPEFAMKRLVAAGSGPIYQIAKAFRAGELGDRHNPEFTLLEWYRPGFDHHALIAELDELMQEVLGTNTAERVSYEAIFQRHVGLDPHRARPADLEAKAAELGLALVGASRLQRDDWLNLLMARVIESNLGHSVPCFVYDFPVDLAALARIRPGEPPVAERFELFFRGMELANGYHELTNASEQRRRFHADAKRREALGRDRVPPDERLLEALASGLPACSGVALGLDRLVMIAAGARSLEEVLSFPLPRA